MRRIIRIAAFALLALPVCAFAQSCPVQRLASPNGQGVMVDSRCTRYEGEFRDGRLHGQGKITHQSGESEEGEFREGRLWGAGIMNRGNGIRYEGMFIDGGLRFGKGRDINGVISEGLFYDSRDLHGFGIRTWPDGTKLVGDFRGGRPAGEVLIVWPDGTGEKRTYAASGGSSSKPVPSKGSAPSAAPAATPAAQKPPPTPARPPQQTDSGSGPTPGQVGDEVNRAIRGLKGIFGR